MKENKESHNQSGGSMGNKRRRKENKIKEEKEWNWVKNERNENQGTEGIKLREEKKGRKMKET